MADDPNFWPNWITAVSTALTVVGGAFAAWVGFRRTNRSYLPTVESRAFWSEQRHDAVVELTIRNRLYETVVLDSARLKRPWRMAFARRVTTGNADERYDYLPGTARELKLGYEIAPLGTIRHASGRLGDSFHTWLVLSPPDGWTGGWVKLELRFSSRSDTIRDKRITVRRHVAVASRTKTDATANN